MFLLAPCLFEAICNLWPLGLPGLKPADQLKVMTGNLWMRFSAWLLRLALEFNIFATLENPERSRLWLCPPLQALFRRRRVHWVVTHYCCWGRPFRKATGFLSVNFELTRLNNTKCVGGKRGICVYTNRPHIQLIGRNSHGQWLTRVAQPYPVQMCNAISKCLYDARVSKVAMNLEKSLV